MCQYTVCVTMTNPKLYSHSYMIMKWNTSKLVTIGLNMKCMTVHMMCVHVILVWHCQPFYMLWHTKGQQCQTNLIPSLHVVVHTSSISIVDCSLWPGKATKMVKISGVDSILMNSSVEPALLKLWSSFTIRPPDRENLNSIAVATPQVFFAVLYNFLTATSYICAILIKQL